MMRLTRLIVLALVLSLSVTTRVLSKDSPKSISEYHPPFADDRQWNDIAYRGSAARAIRKNVDGVLSYVSKPSPSDEKWLESEEAAVKKLLRTDNETYKKRLVALYGSVEFANFQLYNYLKEIRDSTNCILVSIRAKTIRYEMYCWATLASQLATTSVMPALGIETLRKKGLFPTSSTHGVMAAGEFSSEWILYRGAGEDILLKIIVPYLRSENDKNLGED